MKTSLYFLFFFIWLTLNGQPNQKSTVLQPVTTHSQAIKLLLQKSTPAPDILTKRLKALQIPATLRSASAQKQQLDSIVGPLEKEIFAYNAQQNLILYITISRDTIGSPWVNNTKEEYGYNAIGNPISEIISQWNDTIKAWIFKEKSEYSYDASGRAISIINSVWIKAQSQWRGDTKTDLTYDNNGNVTLYWGYKWDTSLNNWINDSKIEYSYNAQKQIISFATYSWEKTNNKWIGQNKVEYTYTAGEITRTISSLWDSVTDNWINSSKTEYTFNAQGRNSQIVYFIWIKETSTWVNSYKFEYTHDVQGNQTSSIMSMWETNGNNWENYSKNEWTYNSGGKVTLSSIFSWIGDWQLIGKTEYNYNTSGQLTSETISTISFDIAMSIDKTEYSYDGSANTIQIKKTSWSIFDQDWTDVSKEERIYNNAYSYSDLVLPYSGISFSSGFTNDTIGLFNHMLTQALITTYDMGVPTEYITKLYYSLFSGLNNFSEKSTTISVYPNPASESITVQTHPNTTSDLNIYNLAGELILKQPITGNTVISVNQFTPGIYLFRITTAGQLIYAEKVVIK